MAFDFGARFLLRAERQPVRSATCQWFSAAREFVTAWRGCKLNGDAIGAYSQTAGMKLQQACSRKPAAKCFRQGDDCIAEILLLGGQNDALPATPQRSAVGFFACFWNAQFLKLANHRSFARCQHVAESPEFDAFPAEWRITAGCGRLAADADERDSICGTRRRTRTYE